MPKDRAKGTRVWLTGIWRDSRYLVYSGTDPMFRWTGARSIKIDLDERYPGFTTMEHIKRLELPDAPILVSLVFGKRDAKNAMP